jgi:hypothetical protein
LIETEQFDSYDKEEAMKENMNQIQKRNIFRIIELFRKINNIIVYIRGSAGRTKKFKELAERIISLDNRTK